jgi:hypothetical protein
MKGLSAKHEPLEQIARHLVGQSKQEYTRGKRASKKLSLPLDRGHERRIREVLQEDGRSSMYRAIIVWLPIWEKIIMDFWFVACMLLRLSCILELSVSLTVVYFCRLKINHDSHEFILESGTVVTTIHIILCHFLCPVIENRYEIE